MQDPSVALNKNDLIWKFNRSRRSLYKQWFRGCSGGSKYISIYIVERDRPRCYPFIHLPLQVILDFMNQPYLIIPFCIFLKKKGLSCWSSLLIVTSFTSHLGLDLWLRAREGTNLSCGGRPPTLEFYEFAWYLNIVESSGHLVRIFELGWGIMGMTFVSKWFPTLLHRRYDTSFEAENLYWMLICPDMLWICVPYANSRIPF